MIKRSIIALLLIMQTAHLSAAARFEQIFAIDPGTHTKIANQVVTERFEESLLSPKQKYISLQNLQKRLENLATEHPDNALIWFLVGLNQNNLAETRFLMLSNQSGQQTASRDIEVSNHNIARSRAYDNAIRLDSTPPHQLSSSIYASMSYGLSNRQKIKTYSRELKLGSASENESNEWFLHWAKIDALVHEKKLDEAQTALSELKALLQQKNRQNSAYSNIAERAESQVNKVKQASNRRTSNNNSQNQTIAEGQKIQDWTWKTWLVTIIGILIFLFVAISAIYYQIRKKNQEPWIQD